jgi:4-hydroxy-tetrahydrodipicolinate synthase
MYREVLKMKSKYKLRGVIPAIVTPMNKNGDVDYSLLEKQAAYLVEAGAHGLFVCGGTGEGAYLTTEEKVNIFKTVKSVAAGRVFLCAALINSSTRATLAELEIFEACGPDFFAATAPYYHAMNQKDLKAHYRAIAKQSYAPVIMYNIPSTTHNPIALETIRELSEEENIIGVKDSSGDFISFSKGLFGPRTEGFSWIQGEDYLCGPSLLSGADGMVSGLSNAKAEPYVEMYRAYEAGDFARIRKCQSKINELYKIIHSCGNGNAAIKTVTELCGRGSRWMRQTSQSLTDEQVKGIAEILERYEQF